MSEPKDSLYDISDAITLSRRLAGRPSPTAPEEASRYIRFSAGRSPADAGQSVRQAEPTPPAAAPSPATKPEFGPLPTAPFQNWEDVLKWCVTFSKAQCGFIVDSQGFVMMTHGENLPADAFEGAGANIGPVYIDLNRMDLDKGNVHIVEMTYAARSLLTMRIVDKAGEYCIVGILSDEIEHVWPKHILYRQIMKNMANLLL